MASFPLSKIDQIIEAVGRHRAAIARIDRLNRLVSVQIFFEGNGTEAETLVDDQIAGVRAVLVLAARQEVEAIDAELRELGVDTEG